MTTTEIQNIIKGYRNVGDFMERADRRTKEYKTLESELERIERLTGKNSAEVNNFFLLKPLNN